MSPDENLRWTAPASGLGPGAGAGAAILLLDEPLSQVDPASAQN